jgi:hypothetical protein
MLAFIWIFVLPISSTPQPVLPIVLVKSHVTPVAQVVELKRGLEVISRACALSIKKKSRFARLFYWVFLMPHCCFYDFSE